MNRNFLAGMLSGSAAAMLAAIPGLAQTGAQGQPVEEVVVTGSRIVRDGFQQPTPVTTLTNQALQQFAPSNIPDALNQLPQFRGSASSTQGNTFNANAPNLGNFLNLRNLGPQRTLVLLDGLRVPPTSFDGKVDVDLLPQMLVQRVDIVTGGASAAYGSDAIVGVVNFVLDKRFEGLEVEAQNGISIHDDAYSYKFGVAAGTDLFDGRAHVEGSWERYQQYGLNIGDRSPGKDLIIFTGAGTKTNPFFAIDNGRYTTQTFGGYIVSGPANLKGQMFLPDGSLTTAHFGAKTGSSNIAIGGDGALFGSPNGPITSLTGGILTDQGFGRASFDITDNLSAFAQMSFGESLNTYTSTADNRQANSANTLTIFSGNAFLPAAVQAAMNSANAPNFVLARQNAEFPAFEQNVLNDAINLTTGIEGKLWKFKWDADYTYGYSILRSRGRETNNQNFYAAVDAVRDPASGQIVCRVTLTNPGLYPGCTPLNLFGYGAPSPAAVNYIFGDTHYQVVNTMNIGDLNFRGDLVNLWAGPISVAFGGEVRSQTLNETSNSNPAIPFNATGLRGVPGTAVLFRSTNVGIASGNVDVKEGYFETVIPLAKDLPLVKSFEINGAFRHTDYSTSGGVDTWKAGASWQPINDLRLRSTVSEDIAAPSLYALFQGPQEGPNLQIDPHTGVTGQWIEITRGNPNLVPEVGHMVVAGAVYEPSWLQGFGASLDGYWLSMDNAFSTTTGPQELLDCEASGGASPVCASIIRPFPFSNRSAANFPTIVYLQPQNAAKLYQSGADLEMHYSMPAEWVTQRLPGIFDFRLLMTYLGAYKTQSDPLTPPIQNAGAGISPISNTPGGMDAKLRGSFQFGYHDDRLNILVTERATGRAKESSTQYYANFGVSPNVFYTDLNVAYHFGEKQQTEAFINIGNLFNKQPPIIPGMSSVGVFPTNKELYDVIGTYFTIGVRQRF